MQSRLWNDRCLHNFSVSSLRDVRHFFKREPVKLFIGLRGIGLLGVGTARHRIARWLQTVACCPAQRRGLARVLD